MKDIQAVMRSDVARVERPTTARKPPPIIMGPMWVAACYDGRRTCFLCRAKLGYWAVVDDPDRAHRFVSEAEAQGACDRFVAFQETVVDRPGAWAPRLMTLKASFQ